MNDSIPKKEEKPIDFIISTLKILQNKSPIPDSFLKKETYKYPFEIINNLSKVQKEETLNKIKKEYNKYFSEEIEIARQYWQSMNYISSFLLLVLLLILLLILFSSSIFCFKFIL